MDRRLTTILALDVGGYSRLMAADEIGTLSNLKALRAELLEPKAVEHRGRVVKQMGDGELMEFGSVVDAVAFAADVQHEIAVRNVSVPEARRIVLRIGINLGDVIIDGDDLYGDGVNIAARLEGLAEPGGVCVSGTVFDHVSGKAPLEFTDLGEHQVKNIPKPLRVYSVAVETEMRKSSDSAPQPGPVDPPPRENDNTGIDIDLSVPESPSIAVLPFNNMSADPEQEFFADGISEDIITTLSKINDLLVIARNSTFTYKGKAVDVRKVSRELGVRYVLEGSVRKAGNRVRITAQLIDGTTGHHLWAERYDRGLDDIFAIQDEITREVVVALDVHLRGGERARIWSDGTANVEAWECVRSGLDALNRITPENHAEARRLLHRAPELDPGNPMAWAALGWFHFHEADFAAGPYKDSVRDAAIDSAMTVAGKALDLDPSCANAYSLMGLCSLERNDCDQAVALTEKAIALAPNLAENLAIAAVVLSKSGRPERSLELIRRAMRLCPIYPGWYLYVLATVCRLVGRNEDAMTAFEATIKRNPNNLAAHVGLASALGELGRRKDAEKPATEILRINPDFSVQKYMEGLSYRDPAERVRFENGLREAGLPE